jgi:hypothetical protein
VLFFFWLISGLINYLLEYEYPNSLVIYTLFTVVEGVAFLSFLWVQIKNKTVKKVSIITGIAFVVFNILYLYFTKNPDKTDFISIPIGIETIIILVFSYYYLYERTDDTSTLYIYSTFGFWVVIGMVIYLSCSFFVYLFIGSIPENEKQFYWDITNVFGIIKNVLFTVAIIINSKPPKRIPPSDFEYSGLN